MREVDIIEIITAPQRDLYVVDLLREAHRRGAESVFLSGGYITVVKLQFLSIRFSFQFVVEIETATSFFRGDGEGFKLPVDDLVFQITLGPKNLRRLDLIWVVLNL